MAVGAALAAKTLKTGKVAVTFTGDGGSNQGTTFEAMNFAAVFKLPALFVFENNGYAETTSSSWSVACGDIVNRAQAFGMKVIAWGPTLTKERAQKAGVTFMALEEVLKTADVVSVHLMLSEQSKGILNEQRLRLMKKSDYLINTARGAMIDENALAKVLREKAIAGAALDVFVEEPLPPSSPLLELDNVVLSPHLGWPTDAGFEGFAERAVENILNYMEGKLTRATNPEALERRRRKSAS